MHHSQVFALVVTASVASTISTVCGFAGLSSLGRQNVPFTSTRLYTGGAMSSRFSDFEFPEDVPNNGRGSSSGSPSPTDNTRRPGVQEDDNRRIQRRRKSQEDKIRSRFVTGDDLHLLRQEVLGLKDELERARRAGAVGRVHDLESAVLRAQAMDAEFIYEVALDRYETAEALGRVEEAKQFKKEAMLARSALPQFNLDGLWVGKYGDHGYEMINVTYVGNTLVAYKVTGEKNVPKGEISFTVDLSPRSRREFNNNKSNNPYQEEHEYYEGALEPIELGESASKQWGSKYLQRFAGRGQVAAEGYVNSQWMDGQLIIVKQYFSFAWLPLSHQVFFGRPSDELTLKLLIESNNRKSKAAVVRHHIEKCMEETELLDDEMECDDKPFFSHDQQDYYNQEGFFD